MQPQIQKPHFLKKEKASTFEARTTIQNQMKLKTRKITEQDKGRIFHKNLR